MKKVALIFICFCFILSGCVNQSIENKDIEQYIQIIYDKDSTGEYGVKLINDFNVPEEGSDLNISAITDDRQISFIGERAGGALSKINFLVIEEGVREIRKAAFATSKIKQIVIPKTTTFIASDAFENADITSIIFYGDRTTWDSWNINLPQSCKLTIYSEWEKQNAEENDQTSSEDSILISNMELGIPYILKNEKISLMQKVGYKSTYVGIKYLNKGSVISGNEKIIVKSDKTLEDVSLQKISIDFNRYYYPYTNFWVNNKKLMALASIGAELKNTAEVDNINGKSASSNISDFPLTHYMDPWSCLYSDNEPKTFTVGYWEGTNYKEVSYVTDYVKFSLEEGIKTEYKKTKNGYFEIELSAFDSGYYIVSGFPGSYIIKIEK